MNENNKKAPDYRACVTALFVGRNSIYVFYTLHLYQDFIQLTCICNSSFSKLRVQIGLHRKLN